MILSESQNAAAMHGLATNPGVSEENRLKCALQALEFYTRALDEEREKNEHPAYVAIGVSEEAPQGWKDLIVSLILMSKGAVGESPTHCEHDELTVCSDPHKLSREELAQLNTLGFFVDNHEESDEGSAADCQEKWCDASFKSFRFGSA